MKPTHIIIPIEDLNEKDDYVHNEIISRIGNLEIPCPECENIDDDQYSCGTCGGYPGTFINVLDWFREQGKKISLDKQDLKDLL